MSLSAGRVCSFSRWPAATREMYRVLAPGGKLVLSVWWEIERSPGFAVLAQALTSHVSREAGALLKSGPFGLSTTEELRKLIAGAGFRDISIRTAAKVLRYPSSDEFVLRYAAGSALAGAVANVGDDARTALLTEVGEAAAVCPRTRTGISDREQYRHCRQVRLVIERL